MEILEFTSDEAAAPLMSVAAPLWFRKLREKKTKILDSFASFENYGEFWEITNCNFQSRRQILSLGTKLTSRAPIYISVVPKFELTALLVHILLCTICNLRAAWGLIVPIDKEDDDMFATFLWDRKTHLGEGRNPSIYLLT